MLTIYLHDSLNDLHPEPIRVHASTVHEAMTALKQYAPFDPRKVKERYAVVVDGIHSLAALHEKTELTELHVRPVVLGAGGRGGIQVIIGIVLMVVGFFTSPYDGGMTFMLGMSMVLGGVIQMMMPQPKIDSGESQEKSRYLGARGNTVAIGTPIPMIFGRMKAWGHYLSFDVDAYDLNTTPAPWYSSPFTDMGETTYSAAPEEVPSLDPQEEAGLPIANFLSYADGVATFTPAVDLPQGQLDLTFNTGRVLNCFNSASGVTNTVQVLGGYVDNLPASGTPIVFSQNYV